MKEDLIKRRYEALLQMVLDINGTGARTKKETGDKPTAMFYFHGHCGDVAININKKGWYPYADDDISLTVDCRKDSEYENACKVLSEFIKEMGRGEY